MIYILKNQIQTYFEAQSYQIWKPASLLLKCYGVLLLSRELGKLGKSPKITE
jgi:hypothetical protein